ncbi:hypothetical protein BV341_05730 [Pseudomonas syringae pv. actinidiae]|nr:hypothetical protein BV341_05730 [Pseudomonas syringae pv. actinidiae]
MIHHPAHQRHNTGSSSCTRRRPPLRRSIALPPLLLLRRPLLHPLLLLPLLFLFPRFPGLLLPRLPLQPSRLPSPFADLTRLPSRLFPCLLLLLHLFLESRLPLPLRGNLGSAHRFRHQHGRHGNVGVLRSGRPLAVALPTHHAGAQHVGQVDGAGGLHVVDDDFVVERGIDGGRDGGAHGVLRREEGRRERKEGLHWVGRVGIGFRW